MSGVRAWVEEGLAHHQAGRLAQAEALYRRALAAAPACADALHLLGALALAAGRPADALDLLDRALALDPTQAASHFNRAETCRALGRLDEARAAYERAV